MKLLGVILSALLTLFMVAWRYQDGPGREGAW